MSAKTFKEGGRGRKQCPRCKVYIAANSAACPGCHLLFEEKKQEKVEQAAPVESKAKPAVKRAEKKKPSPQTFSRYLGLRIPDGSNPVPLKGRDKTSLLTWAEAVRQHWLQKGYWLAKEGLCYYLMWEPQFDDRPKLYDAACQIIQDNLTDDKPEPPTP